MLKILILSLFLQLILIVSLTWTYHLLRIVIRITYWRWKAVFILVYLRKRLIIWLDMLCCIYIIVDRFFQINIIYFLNLCELIFIWRSIFLFVSVVLIISELFLCKFKCPLTHRHWYFIMLVQTTVRSDCFQCFLLGSLFTWICRSNVFSLLLAACDIIVFLLLLNIYYLVSTSHIVSLNHLLGQLIIIFFDIHYRLWFVSISYSFFWDYFIII